MMCSPKIIMRNCCILLALCVSFICVPQCYAADNSADITAPDKTTQIWFDIEGTDIKPNEIGGKIDNHDMKFASSPSGITSVVSTGGGTHKLSLKAIKQHVNQTVFISFVNSNRIVLKESKLTMTLAGGFKIDDYYPNTNTDINNDSSYNGSNNSISNNFNSNNSINSSLNSISSIINGSKNDHIDSSNSNTIKTDKSNQNPGSSIKPNSNSNSSSNLNLKSGSDSNSDSAKANNNSGQAFSSQSENNKHKRFSGMLYATGVGVTLILITSILLISFGIGIHFSVNGAHVKREA